MYISLLMSGEIEKSFYEEDIEGNKRFKSKRWSDLHGGLANASATPDQRLDMQSVQDPRSEVMLDKVKQQKYDYLHGDHGPKASLPVLVNMLNTQIETLKTMKAIQDLLEFQIPIGQVRGFSVTYTLPGFTHIDFADSTQTYGLPSGVIINEPNRKLMRLRIFNDGDADIKFSSNIPRSDRSADILLKSGESDDSLHFLYNVIWSININVIPNSGSGGTKNSAT